MALLLRARLSVALSASVVCNYAACAAPPVAPPVGPPGTVLPNAADANPPSETSRPTVAVVGLGKAVRSQVVSQAVGPGASQRDAKGVPQAMPMVPPKH